MFLGDTIVAISTPAGRGGIGVVRISGPASLDIAAVLFQPRTSGSLQESHRARFGRVIDPTSGESIDDAIVTYFRAPHSYTGEDVVELSCHGSPVLLGRVLQLALAHGGRVAEPGEFTFRAFFNKRIDLAQAQAVRDLINAQTQYQARVATRQLEGALATRLSPLKQGLIEIMVQLESSVEFAEDDISTSTLSELASRMACIQDELQIIASSFSFGRFVKEGFALAIVGRPNVGKSSVFNRLIGTDRAIVTSLPGTTRDALHESTSICGVPVRLIDTAGIRETTDVIETIGITRSRAAIADADISVLVLDASESLSDDDIRLLHQVPEQSRIIVYNKIDLLGHPRPGFLEPALGVEAIPISALTGEGFDRLSQSILSYLSDDCAGERDDIMITDARQHASICLAIERLADARELIKGKELEEVVLLKMRGSLDALGEITGETLTEDILGQIFSTFCIGK